MNAMELLTVQRVTSDGKADSWRGVATQPILLSPRFVSEIVGNGYCKCYKYGRGFCLT